MNHVIESGKEVFLVTITLEEYRELVTKCARYDLLQEQEAQQKAEMEAFRASLAKDMINKADTEKPAQAKKANPAISTEICEK